MSLAEHLLTVCQYEGKINIHMFNRLSDAVLCFTLYVGVTTGVLGCEYVREKR